MYLGRRTSFAPGFKHNRGEPEPNANYHVTRARNTQTRGTSRDSVHQDHRFSASQLERNWFCLQRPWLFLKVVTPYFEEIAGSRGPRQHAGAWPAFPGLSLPYALIRCTHDRAWARARVGVGPNDVQQSREFSRETRQRVLANMADRFSIILTSNFWLERNTLLSDFHFTLRVFLGIIRRNFLFGHFDIDWLWRGKLIFYTFLLCEMLQGICDFQYGGSFFDSFHFEFLVLIGFSFWKVFGCGWKEFF